MTCPLCAGIAVDPGPSGATVDCIHGVPLPVAALPGAPTLSEAEAWEAIEALWRPSAPLFGPALDDGAWVLTGRRP